MKTNVILFFIFTLLVSCSDRKDEKLKDLEQYITNLEKYEFCYSLFHYNMNSNDFNKVNFEIFLKNNNRSLYDILKKSDFNYKVVDTTTVELGILIDGIDNKFNANQDVIDNVVEYDDKTNFNKDLLYRNCSQFPYNNSVAYGYIMGSPFKAESLKKHIEDIGLDRGEKINYIIKIDKYGLNVMSTNLESKDMKKLNNKILSHIEGMINRYDFIIVKITNTPTIDQEEK